MCFGGHIGRHLGFWNSYAIFTASDQNLDIEYIKIDSLFVFVAGQLRHRAISVLAAILVAILEFKLFTSMQVLVLESMVNLNI